MTADAPGSDDTAVASRLAALDDVPTTDHLAVYTAIAVELAARLDEPSWPRSDGFNPSSAATTADVSGGAGG